MTKRAPKYKRSGKTSSKENVLPQRMNNIPAMSGRLFISEGVAKQSLKF
jgi:hypothetical protein